MNLNLKIDPNRLLIFHELKKRRIYVGELLYDNKQDVYKLIYNEHYANSGNAIPLGPGLNLFKKVHISEQGKLFSEFADRIPERTNPAYADYCHSQGIDVNESNPIILLGSIGSRGPSSFVFEKTYTAVVPIDEIIKLRSTLDITQHDFAEALGISKVTLQKIEAGSSSDIKTIKLLQVYFTFPEVAIWQLHQTGAMVHSFVLSKLFTYFHEKLKGTREDSKNIPKVVLIPLAGKLILNNIGQDDIYLFGSKFADSQPEYVAEPRLVPINHHYYFLTDSLEALVRIKFGTNGSESVPFSIYLSDISGNKYEAKFFLLIKMINGSMEVHTQQGVKVIKL